MNATKKNVDVTSIVIDCDSYKRQGQVFITHGKLPRTTHAMEWNVSMKLFNKVSVDLN
ncbi:MAG: hypothetical protein ACI8RD_002994 [Bacillariaceae sp.]|jgi:hypothetical protein